MKIPEYLPRLGRMPQGDRTVNEWSLIIGASTFLALGYAFALLVHSQARAAVPRHISANGSFFRRSTGNGGSPVNQPRSSDGVRLTRSGSMESDLTAFGETGRPRIVLIVRTDLRMVRLLLKKQAVAIATFCAAAHTLQHTKSLWLPTGRPWAATCRHKCHQLLSSQHLLAWLGSSGVHCAVAPNNELSAKQRAWRTVSS